jgi:hypothetical protein
LVELDGRLEREGRELDSGTSGEMVGDDEDPIPFSAKTDNGSPDKATPGASPEQNEAEQHINATGTGE